MDFCKRMSLFELQSMSHCIKYVDIFGFYSTVIATNLLLVDEIMRAGMTSLKG